MRYAAIIKDDVVNGEGVCTSFFIQGCPHHCKGCFNQDTWDFEGGLPYGPSVKWEIIRSIGANGFNRGFSVLGGEPMAPQNTRMVLDVLNAVRAAYPNITIYLWTGYTMEELNDPIHQEILVKIDCLIDGQYIDELRDLSLKMRGSINQRIWRKKNGRWEQQC